MPKEDTIHDWVAGLKIHPHAERSVSAYVPETLAVRLEIMALLGRRHRRRFRTIKSIVIYALERVVDEHEHRHPSEWTE